MIDELGSWDGSSARWFAENMPPGWVPICIDHWRGSREHQRTRDARWAERLAKLYQTFLDNLAPYRERLIPMRIGTVAGMAELASLDVQPDILHVDASHEEKDVFDDTTTAKGRFPDADICGDDWMRQGVRAGVVRAAGKWKLLDVFHCCFWHLKHEGRTHAERKQEHGTGH